MPATIFLSKGMLSCLHVCSQTLQLLKERRVKVYMLPTAESVDLYNQLRDREKVGTTPHDVLTWLQPYATSAIARSP